MTGILLTPGSTGLISAGAPTTGPFAFVLNVTRLVGADHFDLAPNHTLRAANANEIAAIRETLGIGKNVGLFKLELPPWEFIRGNDGSITPISEESEWKYFVIAFQGPNDTIVNLENAFCLTRAELRIGFTAALGPSPGMSSHTFHHGRLFQYVHAPIWKPLPTFEFTQEDANEIAEVNTQLQNNDEDIMATRRIVSQILELEELNPHSPLKFFGYFAILEGLITHSPDAKDPSDSITRQIKTKLKLLNNRFTNAIGYSKFGGVSVEKVWSAMYEYRSCLAHGGMPNFKKDQRLLGSPDQALELLRSTVKAVARYALTEPQLIRDLRIC